MYGTECHVTASRSPVKKAIGRIVNAAIGITEAMIAITSMPTRIIRLVTRYTHQNVIEMNAMALPNQLASPLAGALNSTSANPASVVAPSTISVALVFSPKRMMPTGTSTTGVSETMNSALATVVWVTALKNSVMFTPKAMPGTIGHAQLAAGDEAPLGDPQGHGPDDARRRPSARTPSSDRGSRPS